MIDICTVIYHNYELLDCQIKQWNWLSGDHNLIVVDATPPFWKKNLSEYKCRLVEKYCKGSDGESHGEALDLAVRAATTPIVGICDSDFFWTRKDIIPMVEAMFAAGHKCVGAELWYRDFGPVNDMYPERAGYLAPCVFGMFIDRELALSETFVVTKAEGLKSYETGWRIRKKIIDEKIPCHVFPAFRMPDQPDSDVTFFGEVQTHARPPKQVGVHFVKGSNDYHGRDTNALFNVFGLEHLYQS